VIGMEKRIIILVTVITVITLVITLSIYLSKPPERVCPVGNFYFYLYGHHACPHCLAMKNFIIENYCSNHFYFCDVRRDASCYELFMDFGNFTQGVPTIFVVYNNTVTAVLIGEYTNKTFLDQLLYYNNRSIIPVFSAGYMGVYLKGVIVLNSTHSDFIEKYLCYQPYCNQSDRELSVSFVFIPANKLNETILNDIRGLFNKSAVRLIVESTSTSGFITILPSLIILSLLDSINPCTFTMYFSFLISCLTGKRDVKPPLLFIIIIYFGYLLFAYGLLKLLYFIPSQIFLLIALFMGIYMVVKSSRGKTISFKCEWCEKLGFISKYLVNMYVLAITLSLISVFILLPCTAGPLLAFIGILKTQSETLYLPALLIYNIIFILPLVLMFIMVFSLGREKKIAKWLKNNADTLEFTSGFLLVFIALILLLAIG